MPTAVHHHTGEVLAQKLDAVGVAPTELARPLPVPANRFTQIVNGNQDVTVAADEATIQAVLHRNPYFRPHDVQSRGAP